MGSLNIRSLLKHSREVKFDVYGKRQKKNFCRLPSALCTVESGYLYLEKHRKTEVILESLSLTFTADGKR